MIDFLQQLRPQQVV